MRCPTCGGTKKIMLDEEPFTCPTCSGTGNLWLKYWTEPERAGLKAMGRELAEHRIYQSPTSHMDIGSMCAIRAYVAAARKARG